MSVPTTGGVVVPPGQSPPFATITPNDHAAWIIISAAVGFSTTLVFAGIRIFIRHTVSPGYGPDDYLLAVASVFVFVQSIVLLVACADGLGKSADLIHPLKLQAVQQLYYASNILYVVPVACSKAAVAYFVLRLTPVRAQKRFIWALLGFLTLWGLAFLFTVALTCELSHPWLLIDQKVQCAGYFLRWEIFEALGCLYELAVFGSVIWLVWGLKTTRTNKIVVIVTFSFRLLLIVITGLRLGSANERDLTTDPTLLLAQFISWTSAEMNYSVLSATITILRPFVSNLATHYGGGHGATGNGYGTGSGSNTYMRSADRTAGSGRGIGLGSFTRSKNRDFELDNMEGKGGTKGAYSYGVASATTARDSRGIHAAAAQAGMAGRKSMDSNDSQKMIIRKDITWTVEDQQ